MIHKIQNYFQENKGDLLGVRKRQQNRDIIRDVRNVLSLIPEGQKILDDLKIYKISVKLDTQMSCEGCYDLKMRQNRETGRRSYQKPVISLNPTNKTAGALAYTLAHEVQHIRQYMSGNQGLEVIGSVKNACLRTRLLEADAESFAVGVAYRLKQMGHDDAWDVLSNYGYKAMGDAYETSITQDAANQENGQARYAAFASWAECRLRVDAYDFETVEYWQEEFQLFKELDEVTTHFRDMTDQESRDICKISGVDYMQFSDKKSPLDVVAETRFIKPVENLHKRMEQSFQEQHQAYLEKNTTAPAKKQRTRFSL